METRPTFPGPSSGQLGTAAEILVACQLMIASGGRFSSYVPLVDADGIDVMIHDKVTHRAIGLQIKSWTFQDATRPQTVQFDIRTSTWRDDPASTCSPSLLTERMPSWKARGCCPPARFTPWPDRAGRR